MEPLTAELAEAYEAKAQFRKFTETLTQGCGPDCGTERADAFYSGLAEQARNRAENAGEYVESREFQTQLELRTGGNTTPTTPIRVDNALRDLILPAETIVHVCIRQATNNTSSISYQ